MLVLRYALPHCMPTYANPHISHPTYFVITLKVLQLGQGTAEIGQMQVVTSGRYRLQCNVLNMHVTCASFDCRPL